MNVLFGLAALVAFISTLMVISRTNAVHALLYLVVSFLAIALIFYLLGAPFVAALEVIIYAGAIIVLFVFAVMVLNLGSSKGVSPGFWARPEAWWGPGLLTMILSIELLYAFMQFGNQQMTATAISPQQVGIALYGPYLLGVEMASMLLLSGLVGAYYLGHQISAKRSSLANTGSPLGNKDGLPTETMQKGDEN
jgi:NADH-quinone oxidoreductase subunit J